ncbi:MAG: gamma-glutamylcyclotransferase [Sphingobacteriales bacterium]|jgi:gamma-glutamylcyclotransferase (GGCT)/AIG2-like uncharacterized protein YtfP|nr:gamma-glutamylcyclotransferase [Sphingobacteriales bacterium]
MQTNHLFVYGSLLSGFQLSSYEYIRRYFHLIGEATVEGTMYDLGTHPVVVNTNTGRSIKGELYEIQNTAEFSFALAQLDDYEGLHPEDGQEVFYCREITDVFIGDKVVNAWIYWYARDVSDRSIVESGDMREYAKGNR